ncbi:MAG: Rossmann-like domain-containing protein, partial [Chloroflexota bacterium]
RSKTTGMVLTPHEGETNAIMHSFPSMIRDSGKIASMPVRRVSEYIKSWNRFEAVIGLAAINSVVNSEDQLVRLGGKPAVEQPQVSIFDYCVDMARGKKVAVIGHFPGLEGLQSVSQLSILEMNPAPGEYPSPACEYILPQQDIVFITATALPNKTLPRLLELSRDAYVVLVGPSAPLSPVLFNHGVDMIASTVLTDHDKAWQAALEGGREAVKQMGKGFYCKLSREEWLVSVR